MSSATGQVPLVGECQIHPTFTSLPLDNVVSASQHVARRGGYATRRSRGRAVNRWKGLDTAWRTRRTCVSTSRRTSRVHGFPNEVADVFNRADDNRLRRVEIICFEHDARPEFGALEPQTYQDDGHARGRCAEHVASIYAFASSGCFSSVAAGTASRQRVNRSLTSR